jgi:hypothetical protein
MDLLRQSAPSQLSVCLFSALTPYRSSYQFISVNLADVGAAINPSAPEESPAAVGERAAEPPIRLR